MYILLKKRLFSSLRDNNKAAEFEQCGFCVILKSTVGYFLTSFSVGDEEKALSARIKAIESLLWDAEKGAWFE